MSHRRRSRPPAAGRGARAAVAGAVLVLVLAAGAPASADDTCVDCHEGLREPRLRQPVVDVTKSVHGEEDLGCSDCHNGNTDTSTVHAHQSEDFRSRIEAGAMPETCGNCHAHTDRFPENLPTDQLTGYRLSVHGQAFARGNRDAASCWNCHESHAVRAPDDPESTVHPDKVVDTCGSCHSDDEIMADTDLPTDQERKWRRSVHGRAYEEWIAKGRPEPTGDAPEHPPGCPDCHGEHEIAEPEHAFEACTGCHEEAWEAFEASPHREAFENKGFLPCVECHGNHAVQEADPSLLGVGSQAACRRCHRRGQEMAETIVELSKRQREAEAEARRARRALEERPSDAGTQVSLESLERQLRELRIAMHSLDEDRIVRATRQLQELTERIEPQTAEGASDDPYQRRLRVVVIVLTVAVAFALAALVGWSRRRT